MAVITTDKVIIIVVVTAIVIVLAYVFRFGRFSRKKQAGTDSNASHQSHPGPSQGSLLQSSMKKLSLQA